MRAGSRRKTGAPAKISLCLKHAAALHVIAQDSGANHRGAVFVGNRDCDMRRRLRRARALRPRQLAENQAEKNGARHRTACRMNGQLKRITAFCGMQKWLSWQGSAKSF